LNNYLIYHLHSDLSNTVTNIDSVTKFQEYIDRAKELGMRALGFSEHGSHFEWLYKKNAIEHAGMKYIHAAEMYVSTNITMNDRIRDNYHCILMAKNYDGFLELNTLITQSFRRDGHFYYTPRISFEELCETSDNIIITTACVAGILGRAPENIKEVFIKFLTENKHRCFLEIQHHNVEEQKKYNLYLLGLSQNNGIPLIAGTDTHALNDIHLDGRKILQLAKNIRFDNEDEWDLSFKTYDELIESYDRQGVLDALIYKEAIDNTNKLYEMVESYKIDATPKYPKLYNNPLETFKKIIWEKLKVNQLISSRYSSKDVIDRIKLELEAYEKAGAVNFMLLQYYLRSWEKENGIFCGPGRGSVSGSEIAYILGITEMDSMKFDLNFSRFINKDRVTMPDIDTDYGEKDREKVRKFILGDHMNLPNLKTAQIITFNTIAMRGAIRDVGRALEIPLETVGLMCNECEDPDKLVKLREKYPKLFNYVDIVIGTIVSMGQHACGVVITDTDMESEMGLCTLSTTEYPVAMLNMKELESLNYIKLDILGLDNVALINDTCKLAGIDKLTPDNIDLEDVNVWKSIRDDTTGIFQWESPFASQYVNKLFSDELIAKIKLLNPKFSYLKWLSFGNGLLRPGANSYRDSVLDGIPYDNGLKEINDFLSQTLGHCVEESQMVQTDTIEIPISDINVGDIVLTKTGFNRVNRKFNNGKRHVTKVVLKNHKSIIATNDHLVYTTTGWKRIDELRMGEGVATRVNFCHTNTYSPGKLRIIAWLLGDGSLNSHKYSASFCNADLNVMNEFAKCVVEEFDDCRVVIKNKPTVNGVDIYYAYVTRINPEINNELKTSFYFWLEEVGLKVESVGQLCHHKSIPHFIFGLDRPYIACFLGAFMDTDVSVRGRIQFVSSSASLASDLEKLINRYGYETSKWDNGYIFRLSIRNERNFINEVYDYTILLKNFHKKQTDGEKIYGEDSPYLLSSIFNKIFEETGETNKRDYAERVGIPRSLLVKGDSQSCQLSQKIVDMAGVDTHNLIYSQIESISSYGNKQVYDLEVEGDHTYVVDGILVHNCVMQEDIMEFLVRFCGYSQSESDSVRRGIAKKVGTEHLLPEIEQRFIKYTSKTYNISKELCADVIIPFLQVVMDSSSYAFSWNHSDSYSYIGYACGYLRYYHTLEFICSSLNLASGDENRTKMIIDYAGKHGIKVLSPVFGLSKSDYYFDKTNNCIYKGVSSIKYMSDSVSEEMNTLYTSITYNRFSEVLYDITELTSINKSQVEILIRLNYFRNFGNINTLLKIYNLYSEIGNSKIIRKNSMPAEPVIASIISRNSKETPAQFSINSIKDVMYEAEDYIISNKMPEISIREMIQTQQEYLGYIDFVTGTQEDRRKLLIVDIEILKSKSGKIWARKLKTHSIGTGKNSEILIFENLFSENPIFKYDIILVNENSLEKKVNGKFINWYLKGYRKV
jgi:DNA polymerase III alpha subunit/intein/homing endonuclease